MSIEQAKVKLYWLEKSRSQRIVWLLEELNIDYEVEISHRDKKTLLAPPELQKVHPLGKSPVITITPPPPPPPAHVNANAGAETEAKPIVLAESGLMTEYLCAHWPEGRRLVPTRWQEGKEGTVCGETEAYLRHQYYIHYTEGSLMPYLVLFLVISRLKSNDVPFFIRPITSIVANRILDTFIAPNVRRNLAMIDEHLATSGGRYLCGDQLTAADILMSFPLIVGQPRFAEVVPGWEREFSRVVDYLALLESSDGYQRSIAKIKELDGGKFSASI